MGARDLLADLADAGVTVTTDGDRLVIRPASKLTDPMRAALRDAKPELLALLAGQPVAAQADEDARPAYMPPAQDRPYRLSKADADVAHAEPWDDGAIGRFQARTARLQRLRFTVQDAEDLAERLHLRDVHADHRHLCLECRHYRPGRCGNQSAAVLLTAEVGGDLATMFQDCAGFAGQGVT